MAVAKGNAGLTELEKQLFRRIAVCGLCQMTLTNPKILSCFHSFCLHCLNDSRPTTQNLQRGMTIFCPICRTDILIPVKGVAALPTNVFVDSIIATADALSSILNLPSFQRTDSSDKRMTYCKTHRKKFDNYCNNCEQIICQLCSKTEHRTHRVISVALATKDLRQMIDSYLNGVESCKAYYSAQDDIICETTREGKTASATMNRMDSTPLGPESRNRYVQIQSPLPTSRTSRNPFKHPEARKFLDSWKEWTRRFSMIINMKGLRGDILKNAKELHKLHETWCNLYEQESPVQQSQNKNSPSRPTRNPTSRTDTDNRSELKVNERRIQKSMANEKRIKDRPTVGLKKQIEAKSYMEANLNKQRKFADESQKAKAKSKPNIADNLHSKQISPGPKVSQDKIEKGMLEAELRELREVNAELQHELTQQLQNEERRKRELEKLIFWIERIETQSAEYQMLTKGHSDNGIRPIEILKVLIVKKIEELSEENRLLFYRIEVLKSQMEEMKSKASSELDTAQWELKAALRVESYLTAELANLKQRLGHGMVDNKQVNDTDLLRELKNLLRWIEREDRQLTEGNMTTEGESENSAIKKIKASIIKTRKELRDNEKRLLQVIEDSDQQMNELRQKLINEEKNYRKLGEEFATEREQLNARIEELENQKQDLQDALQHQKEINHTVQEKLKAALVKNRDETSLRQQLEHSVAHKNELSLIQRELEHLIQWIDTCNKQSTDEITLDEKSQNDTVHRLKASVIKKIKELKATEKQLMEESDRQITKLKQSAYSEQQKHQDLRNSNERLHKELMEKERILKAQEKQLNIMGNEIRQPREVLKQQVELRNSRPTREKLDQVSPTGAQLFTDVTTLEHQRFNNKNNFDASTAVQIVANKRQRAPTGIRNMGNTCYFGATIQNLVHTSLLNEELLLCHRKQSPSDIELTDAYVNFLPKGYEANCDETFRHMYKAFCKKSSRFADRGQHDSHDLFVNFLNCLRDEERRRLGSVNSPGFRNMLTAVDKVFGGHTITVYVCSTCKTPYHVCEPFLDISVPILGPTDGEEDEDEDLFINHLHNPQSIGALDSVRQAVEVTMRPHGIRSGLKTPQRIFEKRSVMPESTGEISLKQCLVYYSRTEQIHNEYLCNPCESAGRPSMTSALKRTLIYNPPAVLVLHLKRFEQTTVGFKKCNQHVTYDEYLDIGPYCSSSCLRMGEPDDANIWYSLYGVVVHKGSLTSGHYIAYIKVRYNCDTRQTKQFMQHTFLNRDQVLNEDDIIRINAGRGMVRSRKEWEPREVEGQWYLADDEYVKAVEKTEALSQAAYLLFYERVAKQKDTVV